MQYRRDRAPGASYFFTLVTFNRRPLLSSAERVAMLREAVRQERERRPFFIDAMVILPDHLHAVWTLPPDDADYSIRWRNIKRAFTQQLVPYLRGAPGPSRLHKGEQAVWQRRFWEHRVRDERDYANHLDYVHFNPVKHGYVVRAADWPFSSIHRYIRAGVLPADWGGEGMEVPASARE